MANVVFAISILIKMHRDMMHEKKIAKSLQKKLYD